MDAVHKRAIEQLLEIAVTRKNKGGYVVLTSGKNPILFDKLKRIGFFDFHVTNKGNVVGRHQVVAFITYGWRALKNGFVAKNGEIDVHHLDGSPGNDHPDNLIYLSDQDHLIVSRATNTEYFGNVQNNKPTPFDKQGKPITGSKHFLANVIHLTLALAKKVYVSVEAVLMNLPALLYKGIVGSMKSLVSKRGRYEYRFNARNISRLLFT